ncbi:hypothetical protein LEP1GSC079_2357 [Leptospira interrogans str. FPW1039]|uniref:Uncharacterized protein n=1 Tax=Leptospira interrogans str. FPW1039 TaxID=1193040 RepID=A0A0F6IIJ3_LEPIR|nr:hypothetical protein LEP1GSC045_0387 [Leptospira interrogans serovar Pomona str. Kennewicki LC82-25]EKN96027.1 hypothetical protein LEP1GSC014_4478 [Leptospira interrogans serovar Pomona str. Pomona]EKO70447.1 hypothetical protein LEP1GSC069_2888 [Leptospira interrogans serovar Canicola str. Fiocruz LV133]EKR37461.1 hypothetical protein LEP1GSC096_1597 [Leptospira interrogans serovar Hebdomadis str. R499]EKR84747.1 hypothetical protein LEP1GSC099_2627 [Leptospira interrogans str. UI 08452]E
MKNKYLKIRNVTKSVGTTTNQNFHGKTYKTQLLPDKKS